jgi:hypothetical protein
MDTLAIRLRGFSAMPNLTLTHFDQRLRDALTDILTKGGVK